MRKQIRPILMSMKVGQDRQDAETRALEIYRMGPEAFDLLIDMGWESLRGNLQENRDLLRAISFSLALFMTRDKPPAGSDSLTRAVDLLIKMAALGFNSAKNCLNHLGFTAKEIWQHHLMTLPQVDRHQNDREVSLSEALIEIELSRALEGSKGLMGDRYGLGKDARHRYDLYRTGPKRFVVRTVKIR